MPARPRAANPRDDQHLLERFAAVAPAAARRPEIRALLACIAGSPYLGDLAVREAATLRLVARLGPRAVMDRVLGSLRALSPRTARAVTAAALRQAKRRAALAIALADLTGAWRLEQVVAALSDLAEAALRASVAHLLRDAHDRGELRLPEPARPEAGCGFVVLGMGKLGARELNYSSDVDLVLLRAPDAGVYRGDSPGAFYTRLARGLVALMETRDADGYVFRMDLRLRPDPTATPPVVAIDAAVGYYESMGQNWERAAMIKARPLAGDLALGAAFLAAIRPFVWRRHLDFAAIADIHGMKQRIDAHHGFEAASQGHGGGPLARIAGLDVKLGAGGIREVEFCAQTMQLVWGGRDPGLRGPRTLEVLRALVTAGHLPRAAAAELAAGYRFLRRVEHRLQMVADRQTHALPKDAAELARFAAFMGYPDAGRFAAALLRHLGRVHGHFTALFETGRGETGLTFGRGRTAAHHRCGAHGHGLRRPPSPRCRRAGVAGRAPPRAAHPGRAPACSPRCCRASCARSAASPTRTRRSAASTSS